MSDVELWAHYQLEDPDSFVGGHTRQDALLRQIRRSLPSGRILEIGFGDGYLLSQLSPYYDAVGADISADVIARMRAAVPTVSFEQIHESGHLPFADHSFDLVVASEVLEHLDDAQLKTSVEEIFRVLRSRGHAILTFPARETLSENECFCPKCNIRFHKWGHKQSWTEEKINRLFGSFKSIKIKEKYFLSANLNSFGKAEALFRIVVSKVKRVSKMTFVVTLSK